LEATAKRATKADQDKNRKGMNKFDELAKGLAKSVTRRAALKKFGVGLAGMALACFGRPNKARATTYQGFCQITKSIGPDTWFAGVCMDISGCVWGASSTDCPPLGTSAGAMNKKGGGGVKSACGYLYNSGRKCSFTI
jgi:hypothetical protein